MTTHTCDTQTFASLGPGDAVVGDDNMIKSGRGYTAIGDRLKCYGACLTVIGTDVYVEGSDSLVKGDGLTLRGPRHYAVGKRIVTIEDEETPHALEDRPDDAPTPRPARGAAPSRRTTHRARRDSPLAPVTAMTRDPITGLTMMMMTTGANSPAFVHGSVVFQ
jgi:hypothetical protein